MVKLGTECRALFSGRRESEARGASCRRGGGARAELRRAAPSGHALLQGHVRPRSLATLALFLLFATLAACRPGGEPPAPEPEEGPPLLLRIELLALEVHVASDALPVAAGSEAMLARRLEASALWSFAEGAGASAEDRPAEGPGAGGERREGPPADGQRSEGQRGEGQPGERQRSEGQRGEGQPGERQRSEGPRGEGATDAASEGERGGRAPLPGALQARLRARVDVQRTGPARWEAEVLLEVVPERRAAIPAPLDAIGRGWVDGAAGDAADRALEEALGEAFELLEGRVLVLLGVDAEVLAALDDGRRALRISAWEEAAERRLEEAAEVARRHMEALAPPLDEEELRELLAVAGLLARLEAAEMAPLLIDRIPTRDPRWLAAFLPALGRLPDPEVGRFLEVLAEGHESELVREQAAHWLGARGRGPGR